MKKIITILCCLMLAANALWAQFIAPDLVAKLNEHDAAVFKTWQDSIGKIGQEHSLLGREYWKLKDLPPSKETQKRIDGVDGEIKALREQERKYVRTITGNFFMKDAPIVFEGKILQSKQYFTEDSTNIRHATLIKITRILRGKEYIKEGLIELQVESTLGNMIQKDVESMTTGWQLPLSMTYGMNCRRENFSEDVTLLFFSNILQDAIPFFKKEDNRNTVVLEDFKKLEYNAYTAVHYPSSDYGYHSGLYGFTVNSKKELIEYTTRYGLDWGKEGKVLLEENSAKTSIELNKLPNKNKRIKNKNSKKNKKSYTAKTMQPPPYSILTLRFNNQIQTSSGGNSYVEFDIEAKTNIDVEFSGGWFNFLMYKHLFPTVSPDSVQFIGNFNSPFYTKSNSFGTYTSNTPSSQDSVNLNFGFYGSGNNNSPKAALNTTYTPMLHVRLKITGCAQGLGAALIPSMPSQLYAAFYYQNTGDYPFNEIVFEATVLKNTPNTPNSPTQICATTFNFLPTTVVGGIDQVLTFNTTQGDFGDSTSTVKIEFANGEFTRYDNGSYKNAHGYDAAAYEEDITTFPTSGYPILTKSLPPYYIKKWTNSQIQVYVPAYVPQGNTADTHVGTGLIRITKSDGTKIYSGTKLNVPYCFHTKLVANNTRWQRHYLTNKYCQKGIRFGIDTSNMPILNRPIGCPSAIQFINGIQGAANLWARHYRWR